MTVAKCESIAFEGHVRRLIAIGLVACTALTPQLVKAQRGLNTCTLKTPSGVITKFSCRWMNSAVHGGTIFVDNNETGARYEVGAEPHNWNAITLHGWHPQACIKSPRGVVVCLVN